MWGITLLICLVIFHPAICTLTGDHICQQEEKFNVNVTRHITRNVTVRTFKWCLQFPPRCSFFEVKPVQETIIVEEEQTRTIDVCCAGYEEIAETFTCRLISQCVNCVNGVCNEDGKCYCDPGYRGDNCTRGCIPERWGRYCRYQCTCERGSCDSTTGSCNCPAAWTGTKCELKCQPGNFGVNCSSKCDCQDLQCNPYNGECIYTNANQNFQPSSTSALNAILNKSDITWITRRDSAKSLIPYRNRTSALPLASARGMLQKYHTFDVQEENKNETSTTFAIAEEQSTERITEISPSYITEPTSSTLNATEASIIETIAITSQSTKHPTTTLTSHILETTEIIMDPETTIPTALKHDNINFKIATSSPLNQQLNVNHMTDSDLIASAKAKSQASSQLKYHEEANRKEFSLDGHSMGRYHEVTKSDEILVETNGDHIIMSDFNLPHEEPYLDDSSGHHTTREINGLLIMIAAISGIGMVMILIIGLVLGIARHNNQMSSGCDKNTDGEVKTNGTTTTMSVKATSIFHTPLPDLPVINNPVFTTPLENTTTFEAHVVCSMNMPFPNQFCKDNREFAEMFYDHPPSTGSYRAVSLPEPPDKTISSVKDADHEPVYDEIPCWQSSESTYQNENTSIYMNSIENKSLF